MVTQTRVSQPLWYPFRLARDSLSTTLIWWLPVRSLQIIKIPIILYDCLDHERITESNGIHTVYLFPSGDSQQIQFVYLRPIRFNHVVLQKTERKGRNHPDYFSLWRDGKPKNSSFLSGLIPCLRRGTRVTWAWFTNTQRPCSRGNSRSN